MNAGNSYDLAVSYAEKTGKMSIRIDLIHDALIDKGRNLYSEGKFEEAKVIHQKNYDMMAEHFNSDDPGALEAAGLFIEDLMHTEEYNEAEKCAHKNHNLMSQHSDAGTLMLIGVALTALL